MSNFPSLVNIWNMGFFLQKIIFCIFIHPGLSIGNNFIFFFILMTRLVTSCYIRFCGWHVLLLCFLARSLNQPVSARHNLNWIFHFIYLDKVVCSLVNCLNIVKKLVAKGGDELWSVLVASLRVRLLYNYFSILINSF